MFHSMNRYSSYSISLQCKKVFFFASFIVLTVIKGFKDLWYIMRTMKPYCPEAWRLQLSHELVKQRALPFVFFLKAESVQDNSLSFHFNVVMTVLAKPEENRGQARFSVVDYLCQRMSVMKALLSVLLSPPTQRSLSEIIMCTDWITATWNWFIKRESFKRRKKTFHENCMDFSAVYIELCKWKQLPLLEISWGYFF